MNQTRSTNQGQRKAKGNNSKKQKQASLKKDLSREPKPRNRSGAPAATGFGQTRIGMKDLLCHEVSWIMGYIYVGNGTLGVTDSVYFETNASAIAPGTSGAGMVPILAADTQIGTTYMSDIEKHYSRKVVRKCSLHFRKLSPSTANSMMFVAAPVRGPGSAGDTVLSVAATASPTLANVLGMQGVTKGIASWEDGSLDLTPYIAGGSGSKQNEFAISRDGDDASTSWGLGSSDLDLIAPAAFIIAGNNTTTALRGTQTHIVVCHQTIDLLDFLGGQAIAVPESFDLKRTLRLARNLNAKVINDNRALMIAKLIQSWIDHDSCEKGSSLSK